VRLMDHQGPLEAGRILITADFVVDETLMS
jgi:hypothetical protein